MRRKKRSAGFTLIEVLIALVVMSVAMAGLIPVLVHVIRANTFGKMTSQAASFSQDKLEELRREPFIDPASPGNPNPKLVPGTHTDPTPLPEPFSRTWVIDDTCALCGTDEVIGIEVTTQWTDRDGTHTARFYSLRANF